MKAYSGREAIGSKGKRRQNRPPATQILRVLPVLMLTLLLAGLPTAAPAEQFSLVPGQAAVGRLAMYVTRQHDVLLDVARTYDLGYTQLMAANRGVDPWIPGAGRRIVIPQLYLLPDVPRQGIVINLGQQRLYYFPPGGGSVETFPIGIGVEAGMTPRGVTRVVAKRTNPAWYPTSAMRVEDPDLPRVIPPGPDNPLGQFALALGWPRYLIHGTNKPDGIGRLVSHGCIRLYPEDISRLFQQVSIGTPVRVINQPVQIAWIGNALYLAVFPNEAQTEAIDDGQRFFPVIPPDLAQRVVDAAGDESNLINWGAVTRAGIERTGIPVRVTRPAPQGLGTAMSTRLGGEH